MNQMPHSPAVMSAELFGTSLANPERRDKWPASVEDIAAVGALAIAETPVTMKKDVMFLDMASIDFDTPSNVVEAAQPAAAIFTTTELKERGINTDLYSFVARDPAAEAVEAQRDIQDHLIRNEILTTGKKSSKTTRSEHTLAA